MTQHCFDLLFNVRLAISFELNSDASHEELIAKAKAWAQHWLDQSWRLDQHATIAPAFGSVLLYEHELPEPVLIITDRQSQGETWLELGDKPHAIDAIKLVKELAELQLPATRAIPELATFITRAREVCGLQKAAADQEQWSASDA
ncbi:MAG: hypothetical protein ACM31O_04525 [Bacteroidota bacterium]